MPKPPLNLNLKTAIKSTGFQPPPSFNLIVSDRTGWVFDIPFQVDVFRNPAHTQARAIAVAQLIFSLLLNPDDGSVRASLVDAVGEDYIEQLRSISHEFTMGVPDSYFWGRIATGDRKPLKHRGQYFDVCSIAAKDAVSRSEEIQTVDVAAVTAIATM